MKRRHATLALAAAGLASTARAQGGPVEGRHYAPLPNALPATPGKIEVLEFFLYTCPHCYAFDPTLEAWVHKLPADVSFRRVPVGVQAMQRLHQRMFYALDAIGALTPAVHSGIFNAIHRDGVEITDEAAAVALVGRLGADTARFKQALNADGVRNKIAQDQKLLETSGISSVPMLVIAGRWRTGPGMGGTPAQDEAAGARQVLSTADFLIKQARQAAGGKTS
ncbi:MAG: thiol:disulfide interchange protein DsbA/DsbL [Roseateles sp.]|jgi:protein dithiol oxidoreductase (disulfide-forming)|nr:disulfide bond formation protein DsbA [Methylibium sp.]MBY0367488.1 thiol:disulfide interchange protein DsbA/DsbL [Burkholderiaceae bacterium]|mmetsp:Transcript_62147/g.171982  ORF Transcript_62147/g.171982 Transcript_62147/m.171982 type:complete len:223 (-) Transcript_62147:986-1654(-)